MMLIRIVIAIAVDNDTCTDSNSNGDSDSYSKRVEGHMSCCQKRFSGGDNHYCIFQF